MLPAALPGITSGCMLAVARAAGETAPLLFTIGVDPRSERSASRGVEHRPVDPDLPNVTQPGGEPLAWGAALTLIVIVLSSPSLARFVTSRFAIR